MAVLEDTAFGLILAEVRRQVDDLNLAGIVNNVIVKKLPWEKNPTAAMAIISPAPEQIVVAEGKSGQQDVRYRALVSLFQPSNRDLVTGLADELLWRQTVRRHFHLSGALKTASSLSSLCIVQTTVEPGEPLLPDRFRMMVDAQFMIVSVRVRENLQ